MANFPTSLDTFANHARGQRIYANVDNTQQEAIRALEEKVGINSSADTNSLDYKINHPAAAAVSSVNGDTGDVTLTQDDVGDGTTYKQYSATEKTKLAGIAAGATVGADWNTNVSNKPTLGDSASKNVGTTAGTVAAGDHNHTGVYAPVLGADDNYVTDAEKTKLSNLSGTNTGDQTLPVKASGADIIAGTDDAKFATAKALVDGGVAFLLDLPIVATGAEVDTGTDNAKMVTAKAMKDSGYLSSMTDVMAASDTVAGKVELATIAETSTGTDTGRGVTPDGLAGSNFGIRYVQITCFDYGTDLATGDGKGYIVIPAGLNGMNLVSVHAKVITAGTTGTTDIQIANVTDAVDMLSTKITIDSTETGSDTAATPAVIDTTKDDVATNDVLRIDVDAASTTKPKGLILTLGLQLP